VLHRGQSPEYEAMTRDGSLSRKKYFLKQKHANFSSGNLYNAITIGQPNTVARHKINPNQNAKVLCADLVA
jgi:hypothetical protein